MYKKRYNLEDTQHKLNQLIEDGKFYLNFEDLLNEIGYNPLDVNEFYIKNIKHRMRYNSKDYYK